MDNAGINVWSPAFLDLLLQIGTNRILFSTDYPYASMEQARTFLDQLPVSLTDNDRIACANAAHTYACDRPYAAQLSPPSPPLRR